MNRIAIGTTLAALIFAAPLPAQRPRVNEVPAGHRPPPGMCRIWLDGVPAGQQPAPTDCATAVRNRPANGRVLFGDDYAKPGAKSFRGADREDEPQRAQRRYPATMPEMIGAILIERGRRTDDVKRWLGEAAYQARYVDSNRDGLPERVSWLNEAGETVQVWVDANGDGRADSVEVWENGRKAITIKP